MGMFLLLCLNVPTQLTAFDLICSISSAKDFLCFPNEKRRVPGQKSSSQFFFGLA